MYKTLTIVLVLALAVFGTCSLKPGGCSFSFDVRWNKNKPVAKQDSKPTIEAKLHD